MFVKRSEYLDASLFASLAFAAAIWLNTATVHSDTPHITAAFTPMVVVLTLLATRAWKSNRDGLIWSLTAAAVVFIWPSLNLNAPTDLLQVVRGKFAVGPAIRNLFVPDNSVEAGLVPGLLTSDVADRGGASTLASPQNSDIARAPRFFTPMLESYSASTSPLERYYISALEKRHGEGLEIELGEIQGITRMPGIFEYLYRNFGIVGNDDRVDAYYVLHERHEPRDAAIEQLNFSTTQELADQGKLKLTASTNCGLVRMQMRIEYAKDPLMFRPSGIELSLSDNDQAVWNGTVMPVPLDRAFVALISPLPATSVQKLFGQGPIHSRRWNTVDYHSSAADLLGSKVRQMRVDRIQCVDHSRFVEDSPAPQTITDSHAATPAPESVKPSSVPLLSSAEKKPDVKSQSPHRLRRNSAKSMKHPAIN
jgi:hypothetical protein